MNNGNRKYEHVRKFVRANWEKMTDDAMAMELQMNTAALRKIRQSLGLKRKTK